MTTYPVLDESLDSGDPFFLYEFRRGELTWKYTSHPSVVSLSPLGNFIPVPISHGRMNQTGQIERISLEVDIPFTDDLAVNQRLPNLYEITTLTIWRAFTSAVSDKYAVIWKGRVVSNRTSGRNFTLICENVHTSVRRAGLRGRFQRSCRHNLYGPGCGLNINDWYETVTVQDLNANVINIPTIAGKTDSFGYYNGGVVKFGNNYGFITDHDGNNLALITPIPDLEVGSTIQIAPGCFLNRLTCQNKFNNVLNFGGVPYLPTANPFAGASIT